MICLPEIPVTRVVSAKPYWSRVHVVLLPIFSFSEVSFALFSGVETLPFDRNFVW